MFGYTLLKAAISTVRVSPCALVVIGLADHTIEPDVALPAAEDVAVDTGVLLLLLLLLLLQPATASAPTAPAMAASCQLLRRDEYPANLCRAIYAPLARDERHTATTRSCTPACYVVAVLSSSPRVRPSPHVPR
jgi:hypothetical protein